MDQRYQLAVELVMYPGHEVFQVAPDRNLETKVMDNVGNSSWCDENYMNFMKDICFSAANGLEMNSASSSKETFPFQPSALAGDDQSTEQLLPGCQEMVFPERLTLEQRYQEAKIPVMDVFSFDHLNPLDESRGGRTKGGFRPIICNRDEAEDSNSNAMSPLHTYLSSVSPEADLFVDFQVLEELPFGRFSGPAKFCTRPAGPGGITGSPFSEFSQKPLDSQAG
ncbi:hypothetical protein KC19_1G063900 [Ceratodon purpureus]|uniref:Uncharacterized protein n=1 Tax=Ceratodon purpureus TaxID=3225 RepID=A0A8T0J5A8_CERPU|nr:hypothetical protein KC19_1G063900 [Ceratodon purpureus]